MGKARDRFEKYIIQLEVMLAQAGEKDSPATWLYENDGRTCLFMLEALGRLYSDIYKKEKFDKIRDWCKDLEDALGEVDYYDGFRKLFSDNLAIPVTVTSWLQEKKKEALTSTDELLKNKKWIGEEAKRTKKLTKILEKTKWLSDKNDAEEIKKAIQEEIDKILMFAAETDNGFTELESQVHEMRRKLRWISIYAKALQGFVQLKDDAVADAALQVYLTPEVVNSPFNLMDSPAENKYILTMQKKYFFALSWLISRLGNIKDEGLKIFVLTSAIQSTENFSASRAHEVATAALQCGENYLEALLQDASAAVQDFVREDYLKNLLLKVEHNPAT